VKSLHIGRDTEPAPYIGAKFDGSASQPGVRTCNRIGAVSKKGDCQIQLRGVRLGGCEARCKQNAQHDGYGGHGFVVRSPRSRKERIPAISIPHGCFLSTRL
jgi:hypothetical protein